MHSGDNVERWSFVSEACLHVENDVQKRTVNQSGMERHSVQSHNGNVCA